MSSIGTRNADSNDFELLNNSALDRLVQNPRLSKCMGRFEIFLEQIEIIPFDKRFDKYVRMAQMVIANAAVHYLDTGKQPIIERRWIGPDAFPAYTPNVTYEVKIEGQNDGVIVHQSTYFDSDIIKGTMTQIDFTSFKSGSVQWIKLSDHDFYRTQVDLLLPRLGFHVLFWEDIENNLRDVMARSAHYYAITKEILLQEKYTKTIGGINYGIRHMEIEPDAYGLVITQSLQRYVEGREELQAMIDFQSFVAQHIENSPEYVHYKNQMNYWIRSIHERMEIFVEQARKIIAQEAIYFSTTKEHRLQRKIHLWSNYFSESDDFVRACTLDLVPEGMHKIKVTQNYYETGKFIKNQGCWVDFTQLRRMD